MSFRKQQQELIQLEISLEKLEQLFSKGEICAADIRCLNCESKNCVWNLCLNLCAARMSCKIEHVCSGDCCKSNAQFIHKNSNLKVSMQRKYLAQLV